MNVISQVSLKGGMDGYILTVSDSLGFKDDIALTPGEVTQLYQLLKKRFEKHETKGKDTRKLCGRSNPSKRNRPKSKSRVIKRSRK